MPEPEHFQSWSWYDAFRSCIIALSSWQLSPSESRTCEVSTAEIYSEKSFFPTIYRAECQKKKLSRSFRTQRSQHCTQGHIIKIIKRIKYNNQSTKFEYLWKELISFYIWNYSQNTRPQLIWFEHILLHDLSAKGLGTSSENLERLFLYNIIFIQLSEQNGKVTRLIF